MVALVEPLLSTQEQGLEQMELQVTLVLIVLSYYLNLEKQNES